MSRLLLQIKRVIDSIKSEETPQVIDMRKVICIFAVLVIMANLCGCIAVWGCGGFYGEENQLEISDKVNSVFGKEIRVDLKADLKEDGIPLPAVMYHSVNKCNTGDYVVSPDELESDFQWIKKNGFTPVFVREAVAYIEGKNDGFPQKPILITFDDGFFNNFTYVLPLIEKYNFKVTIAVVGSFVEAEKGQAQHNAYSNLNKEQLAVMHKSGLVEFANHTYDLHGFKNGRKGVSRKYNEPIWAYKSVIERDVEKTQQLLCKVTGEKPVCFSYPYGIFEKATAGIIKDMGFKATFTCFEFVTVIRREETFPEIGRYNRRSGISSDASFGKFCK